MVVPALSAQGSSEAAAFRLQGHVRPGALKPRLLREPLTLPALCQAGPHHPLVGTSRSDFTKLVRAPEVTWPSGGPWGGQGRCRPQPRAGPAWSGLCIPPAGAWMGGEGGGGAVAPRFGRGQGQGQRAVGRQLRREHPLVGTTLATWGLWVEGEVRTVGLGLSPERKEAICETRPRLGEEKS